ncbi:MAG: hypothetical protein P1V51_22240 [Deltaproteobacteria bacterium]|nr:hypothetical protein [Deltaproteobacteria bacterium]
MRSTGSFVSLSLLLGLGALGCADELSSPTLLDRPRILALSASPLEPVVGETVTVTPAVYLPAGSTDATTEAAFCPFSLGSASAFACIDPVCERPVTVGADGAVTFDPAAEAFACAGALGLDVQATGAVPGAGLPSTLETHLRYRLLTPGAEPREAVLRLPLHLEAPARPLNRAPVIAAVTLDGTPVARGDSLAVGAGPLTLGVRIDPESLDTIPVAGEADATRLEEPIVAFHATGGSFEYAFAFGDEVAITYEPDTTESELWLVVRDGRGGQAAFGPLYLRP